MNRIALSDNQAYVWFLCFDTVTERSLRDCELVLSADEKERWQRFSFEEGRRQYLLSHGFLRFVLSRYADVSPEEWRFTRDAYGKPAITLSGQKELQSLSFNLTHTNGLAACAVARELEIGVDAEDITRRGRDISDELIRYCLSSVERERFEMLPVEQRKSGFFDYWTLKEAYLKARGFGLSLPVEAVAFRWPSSDSHQGTVEVSFTLEINDDPQTWQFERFMPTARHTIALAVRRPADTAMAVSLREFTF